MSEILLEGTGEFGTYQMLKLSTDLVPHSHSEAQFVIALDKLVNDITVVGGEPLPLNYENAIFINPKEKHALTVRSKGGTMLVFYISENWMANMFENPATGNGYLENQIQISEKMHILINLFVSSSDTSPTEDESNLWLEKMADHLQFFSKASEHEIIPDQNGFAKAKVEQAIAYMDQNLLIHRDINILAKAIGVSRTQLFRLFRHQLKTTPNIYWNALRMEYARKQLLDETVRVADISDALGFSDPANFSRFFKDHAGFNASGFRSSTIS